MATHIFTDNDDNSELEVTEVLGQALDPRLSFVPADDVPYLDRCEVVQLRDFLNVWIARTRV